MVTHHSNSPLAQQEKVEPGTKYRKLYEKNLERQFTITNMVGLRVRCSKPEKNLRHFR